MKRLLTAICMTGLLSCGGSTEPSGVPGTAVFKIDGVSCVYPGSKNVTFFIAGDSVGIQSLAAGATATGYRTKPSSSYTSPGNPIVQARVASYTATGGALWTYRSNIVVPANGSVTHSFTC